MPKTKKVRLQELGEYIQDKVCHCDIMNGYYCGHISTVREIIKKARVALK